MRKLALFVLCLGQYVFAAELHVPADYATVQDAINVALPFDEVIVAPGTYTGTVFTQNKDITIRSQNPDDPDVVNNTKFTGNPAFWCIGFEMFLSIDGFKFSGSCGGGGFGGCGTAINGEDSSVSVRNSVFVNTSIVACGGTIAYCSFTVCSTCHAINGCDDATIMFCNVSGGYSSVANSPNATILGCDFNNQNDRSIYSCSNAEIKSCIFEGNEIAISSTSASDATNISNCLFAGNKTAIQKTDGNLQVRNSAFWYNTTNFTGTVTPTYCYINAPGQGNLFTYPYFTSPGWRNPQTNQWIPGDYHLLPQSPFFNAGDPNYVALPGETDADGNPRIEVVEYKFDIEK